MREREHVPLDAVSDGEAVPRFRRRHAAAALARCHAEVTQR
jgi:hypothetical protein